VSASCPLRSFAIAKLALMMILVRSKKSLGKPSINRRKVLVRAMTTGTTISHGDLSLAGASGVGTPLCRYL
jgi:hypothetical protein